VTIGLPVYNGARHLERTLQALLAQDMPDFELVISDNASTDETPRICQAFAAKDRRIRLLRQSENLGASRNFGVVLAEAKTPCFLWAAHDDRIAPTYLRKTLAALDAHPSAVLAVSRVRFVDGEGRDHPKLRDSDNLHTLGLSRVERLRRLFTRLRGVAIYGLARTEHLRRAGMEKPVVGQDILALVHLLLIGDVVRVDEPLFEYRIEQAKRAKDHLRQMGSSVVPVRPFTQLFTEAMRMVFASDWTDQEKEATLIAAVVTVARENGSWRRLIGKEHFGRLHRWSRRAFAAHLCWITGRELPGGTPWSRQLRRLGELQRVFGRDPDAAVAAR
jgi:hypothetical protein